MDSSNVAVVILVGGPTCCTPFRPLSLDLPKPLFPIANKPLIRHHIEACERDLRGCLKKIILAGAYDAREFEGLIEDCRRDLSVRVEYVKEALLLGTATALFQLRTKILTEDVSYFFLMHSDTCCAFPLRDMLGFHASHGKGVTLMGKRVPAQEARNHDCYVASSSTHEVFHYARRQKTFVSDTVNTHLYVFSVRVLHVLLDLETFKKNYLAVADGSELEKLNLESHVLPVLISLSMMNTYEYRGFWAALRGAGTANDCSRLYLEHYAQERPEVLSRASNYLNPVIVHETAKVDPTSRIGPNVCIGPNCVVSAGARIANSILLANCTVGESACILHSILSEGCSVGRWTHVRGTAQAEGSKERITILGHSVKVDSDIIIRRCIVMPQKRLQQNFFDEILL